MKKLITSFLVLFLLIGIGTKSYGQASGDYVFVQPVATDSAWLNLNNWALSNGAGGTTAATRLPGATDNVFILSGKGVSTSISQPATFASGSTTITLNAPNASITVGMTVSGTGIPSGALVSSVSGTSVTLSAATTLAAAAAVRLIFTVPTSTGAVTLSSTSVTLTAAANPSVVPGMLITGTGIATGTTVQSVSGTTVTLSQAATATNAASTLTFAVNGNCKNLTVSGAFKNSISFVVNGDVTVNSGALLTMDNEMYCKNVTNYGTFNASAGYRSAKSLFVGFNAKVPGNSDYTIINDGVFGDTAPKLPQGTTSGIKVLYSNQANSFTVKPSTSTVSGYAFNIAQILPHSNVKTTANTNLNIKETMSLLIHNGIGLSIQNTDTCTGTTRTCTIDPGITVYIGYRFHSGGPTTNDQGNFIYNVYGTLDLGTYATPVNSAPPTTGSTDFGLSMSSVAGNAGSLTFNLGDGTQAKAGTLILGSNVKLIKLRTQTIAINFKDYSTVKVTGNYGQAMNYQMLNSNVPALYLFPKKYYNLTLDGAGVVLPVVAAIKGTKIYTNYLPTTASTWAANSSATQGSIIFTGSNYYYVPVVKGTSSYLKDNPITLNADTILNYIKVGQTANSSGSGLSGLTVSAVSGNQITFSVAPSATATQTNKDITFTGKSDAAAANTPTGTSSDSNNPVIDGTQCLIYLGGIDFITASTVLPTAVNSPDATSDVFVYSIERNKLVIANATEGDIAAVYTVSGIKVASAKLTTDKTTLNIASGIYLVKVNSSVSKVIVR